MREVRPRDWSLTRAIINTVRTQEYIDEAELVRMFREAHAPRKRRQKIVRDLRKYGMLREEPS